MLYYEDYYDFKGLCRYRLVGLVYTILYKSQMSKNASFEYSIYKWNLQNLSLKEFRRSFTSDH